MEKFSKWRDFKTGVHPFNTKTTFSTKDIFIGILFFPHKTFLILFSLVSLLLLQFVPIPFIQKFFMKVILFCCGIFSVETKDKTKTKSTNDNKQTIILSNHQSFIDIIIHQLTFNPTFVFPLEEKEDSEDVVVLSFFEALKRSIFNIPFDKKKTMKLSDVKNEVIVYFVEGTTANGKIALKPRMKPLENVSKETEMKLCSLKYQEGINVYYDQSGSLIKYVFGLISTTNCDVVMTIDNCEDVTEEKLADFYRNTMKIATSSFNSADKVEFVQLALKKK